MNKYSKFEIKSLVYCLLMVCGILNITLNLFIAEGEVRPMLTFRLIHLAHVQFWGTRPQLCTVYRSYWDTYFNIT